MKRRAFIRGLFAAAAALPFILDTEAEALCLKSPIAVPEIQPAWMAHPPWEDLWPRQERMSIRLSQAYDLVSAAQVQKLDVIYGIATINPEYPVRLVKMDDAGVMITGNAQVYRVERKSNPWTHPHLATSVLP